MRGTSSPSRSLTDGSAIAASNPENAVLLAKKDRVEIKISKGKLRSSEYTLTAAKAELLPKVSVAGDYGPSGNRMTHEHPAGDVGLQVQMPFFDGGQIQGAIKEKASRQRQSELILEGLEKDIEEDAYLSFRDLQTGSQMVASADKALSLASRQLRMARDRFLTGAGDNIEVLSAQTALAGARQAYVSALAAYHVARVNLYSSIGQVDSFYLKKSIKS